MSVIPFLKKGNDWKIVDSQSEYFVAGGPTGHAIWIENFNAGQFDEKGQTNCSYDLRVGPEYYDHLTARTIPVPQPKKAFTVLPGEAATIQTEEWLHFPNTVFGHVVPKVGLVMGKGLSTVPSKVDPGFNGRLRVTILNISKKPLELSRCEPFCAMVLMDVSGGDEVRPYSKPQKDWPGQGEKGRWERVQDQLAPHHTLLVLLSLVLSSVVTIVIIVSTIFQIIGSTPK